MPSFNTTPFRYKSVQQDLDNCRDKYKETISEHQKKIVELENLARNRVSQAGEGNREIEDTAWLEYMYKLLLDNGYRLDVGSGSDANRNFVKIVGLLDEWHKLNESEVDKPNSRQTRIRIAELLKISENCSKQDREIQTLKTQLAAAKKRLQETTEVPSSYRWEYRNQGGLKFHSNLITSLQSALNTALGLQMSQLLNDSKVCTGRDKIKIDWDSAYPQGGVVDGLTTKTIIDTTSSLTKEMMKQPQIPHVTSKRDIASSDLLCEFVSGPNFYHSRQFMLLFYR